MAKEFAGHAPMNAMMGWNEGVESKNDAIELAKGFIQRRYTAHEASWYAVEPFMGGFLWEVHEGGPGKGYIGAAIKALSEEPDGKFWFPSADRAFQIMMRDGKPFGILLSKAESLPVMNSGQPPLAAMTRMSPAIRKGTGVFLAGAAMLGSAALFMVSSMTFYAISANPGPGLRAVDFSAMPHAQWHQVADTHVEEIVSKLEMSGGKWTVEKRPHVIDGLRELREEGQSLIQKAREGIAPMPVDDADQSAEPSRPSPNVPAAVQRPQVSPQQPMSPAERRRLAREQAAQGQLSPVPGVAVPEVPAGVIPSAAETGRAEPRRPLMPDQSLPTDLPGFDTPPPPGEAPPPVANEGDAE